MKFSLPLFIISAITSDALAASVSTGLRGGGNGERALEGAIAGTYLLGDIQYEQGSGATGPEEVDAIELPDGQILELTNTGLPPGQYKNQFKSGADEIVLPSGTTIKNGKADLKGMPPQANGGGNPFTRNLKGERTPEQERNLAELRRNLATVTGDKSVLVVRVIANGGSTSASQARLSDSVFGNGNDPVTLTSQYAACSHNQLNIVKAADRTGSSTTISDGSVTVNLPSVSPSQGDSTMRNAITAELNSQFGVSSPTALANHVMYCLPPGTMGGIAYAYINSWNSVYSDWWCTYLSTQMHELGHNLNLAHSNEGTQTYADQSGMMGYSYSQDNGPIMCWNNAKLWQLDWFPSAKRTVSAGVNEAVTHIIKGQGIIGEEPGVIKIGNHYIGFNRANGYNSGTVEGGNQVTIQTYSGSGYGESVLVAKLSAGATYTIGQDTITVASIVGNEATIEFNGGSSGPVTPQPTSPPTTPAPTNQPTTPPPTSQPTDPPTPSPTVSASPTKAPTPPPTNAPTKMPTPFPTNQPTDCNLAAVGVSCVDGSNCCSGLCSGGKKADRVCLAGNNEGPTPTPPPTPAPVASPTGPTPPATPPPTPSCLPGDATFQACGDCCNGCFTNGGKAGTCKA